MFQETESQLEEEEDTVLLDAMNTLRSQMEVTIHLLHQRVKSKEITVPPVTVAAQKKTAMTKELEVDYQPVPLIRHQVKEKNPDVFPAKTTGGSQAPSNIFPHIEMGPASLKEQFKLPQDVIESTQVKKPSRKRQADAQDDVPPKVPKKMATRSASKQSSSATPSVTVSIPLSSLQPPPPTAVAPSGSPKKYVCTSCGYTTDRKHDFENHMNQHRGLKFPCGTCGKPFYSESARKQHIQTTHLDIKRARCCVPDCNWEDKDFGKKKVHEYDAHGIGKPAKCDLCGRKLDNWRSFTRHQTTCGREKIRSALNARNVTKIWKGSLSTWRKHIRARATPPRCVISVEKFSGTKTPLGPTSLPTATKEVNVPPVLTSDTRKHVSECHSSKPVYETV